MVAINKKTNDKYDVIFYDVNVSEKGSDTYFGKPKLILYSPRSRYSFEANRDEFFIVDSHAVSGQNPYHDWADFKWEFNGNKPVKYPQ